MPALAAGGDGARRHAVPELHGGDKAVPAGAIPLPGTRIGPGPKRGERAPSRRRERHRAAHPGVVKCLHDAAVVALEAVDLAPGRLPGAELLREQPAGLNERIQTLSHGRTINHVIGDRLAGLARGGANMLREAGGPEHGKRGWYRRGRPAIVPGPERINLLVAV